MACRGGAFPARQHLEASKAIARLHGLDPERTLFVEQSEEAIAAGAFHNDVVAVANERVLFAHELAFADTRRAVVACCERRVPGFEYVEVPAAEVPLADAIRSYLFNAQLVTPPDGETDPGRARPRRGRRPPSGLDRAPPRRQRPDPPRRSRRRPPVDGQWRRAGLPAPARRRRSRRRSIRASWSTMRSSTDCRGRSPHWPEQIDHGELQKPALIADVEARAHRAARRARPGRARLSANVPKRDELPVLTPILTLFFRHGNGSKPPSIVQTLTMAMLKKIGRLFTIKTRIEAWLVTYAIAVGAVERGRHYLEIYPGIGGWLLALACTGVVFIAGRQAARFRATRPAVARSGLIARAVQRRRDLIRSRPRSRLTRSGSGSPLSLRRD